MDNTAIKEITRGVKHEFMAFRNGIVADTLRNAGLPHKVIFGLQLPQITEISRNLRNSLSDEECQCVARSLWEDREVRESRMLACRIMPAELIEKDEAIAMVSDIRSREEADILAFTLLRSIPDADEIAQLFKTDLDPLKKYASEAIIRNLCRQ